MLYTHKGGLKTRNESGNRKKNYFSVLYDRMW